MITFQVFYVFFFLGGGGGFGGECLICLIVSIVKLLTGFEAFVPYVKDFKLGVSIVIWDGAAIVLMLKVVGVSTVQSAVYEHCFYNDT